MVLGHDGSEGLVHHVQGDHVHVLINGQAELARPLREVGIDTADLNCILTLNRVGTLT